MTMTTRFRSLWFQFDFQWFEFDHEFQREAGSEEEDQEKKEKHWKRRKRRKKERQSEKQSKKKKKKKTKKTNKNLIDLFLLLNWVWRCLNCFGCLCCSRVVCRCWWFCSPAVFDPLLCLCPCFVCWFSSNKWVRRPISLWIPHFFPCIPVNRIWFLHWRHKHAFQLMKVDIFLCCSNRKIREEERNDREDSHRGDRENVHRQPNRNHTDEEREKRVSGLTHTKRRRRKKKKKKKNSHPPEVYVILLRWCRWAFAECGLRIADIWDSFVNRIRTSVDEVDEKKTKTKSSTLFHRESVVRWIE